MVNLEAVPLSTDSVCLCCQQNGGLCLLASQAYLISSFQESVDLPCRPQLLVVPDCDGFGVCYNINTLGHVGSNRPCVLLRVCGVVVGGSYSKYGPVCGVETVLECL